MADLAALTDFSRVTIPDGETEMSRRYLRIMMRWIPVGMSYFEDWPGRPNCGHFFGGVLWYGQDTAHPILAAALAASSPEYDAKVAGISAEELRGVALKGLRYLCFTHDTGPTDCVRPDDPWGRAVLSGTKWGERGKGFFCESQCGPIIAHLAVTAALIRELLGDEEKRCLADIAADYLERFGDMEPRAGVYSNTQTEENAWTALGLMSCLTLLPGHARHDELIEHARRWLFRTTTRPEDVLNRSEFADGKTARDCCGRTFTTLPDGTAENHGFVHPSYMGCSVTFTGALLNLLHLFGAPVPPDAFWHRRDTYNLLKVWCDATGQPHCVQGMDWPYLAHSGWCSFHSVGNVYLRDPDAALLEGRALAVLERVSEAHEGRMVPADEAKHCHGQQDPAVMRERLIARVASAYLVHRLCGDGEGPPKGQDFDQRMRGVYIYPHGGALIHRHSRGATSLAWRNRTMVLPATREGIKLISPAGGVLASFTVRGKAKSSRPIALKVRDSNDQVCALVVQNLDQDSVRRDLFFVSLASGKCVIMERLVALEDIVVEEVRQGRINVINDGYFGDTPDLRGHRRVFWEHGEREFEGFAAASADNDEVVDLAPTRWVNIDDRCGLVFSGPGRTIYTNRHYFKRWRAVENELVLSATDEPAQHKEGDRIAEQAVLWCPEQRHEETARQELKLYEAATDLFAAEVDGILCACNFGDEDRTLPEPIRVAAGGSFPISWGVSGTPSHGLAVAVKLAAHEPAIVELQ